MATGINGHSQPSFVSRQQKGKGNKMKQSKAKCMMKLLKSMKYICAGILLAIFASQALTSYTKIKSGKMSFTSSSQYERMFTFPSLTICETMNAEFTGGMQNNQWPKPDRYNVAFPFKNIGYVSDSKFAEIGQFLSPNLNSEKALTDLDMEVKDVWTFSVNGQFAEPCPCYTYQPKGQRTSGFFNSIMFRFKASANPMVKYIIAVHNHNAFVPSLADIFGNAVSMESVLDPKNDSSQQQMFVFFRSNVTELSSQEYNCSHDASLQQDGNPGLAMSTNGPKTVEQCVIDYYHRELGCKLPWIQENSTLDTCNTEEQYIKLKSLINALIDNASKMSYWKILECQPRCEHTQYSLKKISKSNFNALKYMGQDDEANMEVYLFATSTEIEVKERVWLYDENDLVADIGGSLGLFLGASIYTLADVILSNVEKFFI